MRNEIFDTKIPHFFVYLDQCVYQFIENFQLSSFGQVRLLETLEWMGEQGRNKVLKSGGARH